MDVDKLRTDWPGEPIRAHNRVDCARPLTKQTDDRISPVIKDPPFPTCLCCYGEINRGLTLGGHKSPLFRQCNSFFFFSLGFFFSSSDTPVRNIWSRNGMASMCSTTRMTSTSIGGRIQRDGLLSHYPTGRDAVV